MSRDTRPIDPADRELAQIADESLTQARRVVNQAANAGSSVKVPLDLALSLGALKNLLDQYDKAKARVKT